LGGKAGIAEFRGIAIDELAAQILFFFTRRVAAPLRCFQVVALLEGIGIRLDDETFSEVFEQVDCDGIGSLARDEVLALVAIIKRAVCEMLQLKLWFNSLVAAGVKKPGRKNDADSSTGGVRASHLVAALGVSRAVADEMIFIANLSESSEVSFTELKQIITNWSH